MKVVIICGLDFYAVGCFYDFHSRIDVSHYYVYCFFFPDASLVTNVLQSMDPNYYYFFLEILIFFTHGDLTKLKLGR